MAIEGIDWNCLEVLRDQSLQFDTIHKSWHWVGLEPDEVVATNPFSVGRPIRQVFILLLEWPP